jgi:histone acetyltransferase (RNA polymerase elongator complex component)
MKRPVVPFFITHQGCPHRCVFCDQEKISGSGGLLPSDDEICGKIAGYARSSGVTGLEVAFFGGSFTCLPRKDQERLLLALRPLMASGEVRSVRVSTRPDAIDDDGAAFLRAMGVTTVELGVQSMNDQVLELAERGHCAADVVGSVTRLKKERIIVGLQLMPGLPGDTPQMSLASLASVLALKPDFLRIYPTVVIAGTPLFRRYSEGSYHPLTLHEAVVLCKIMLHRALLSGIPVIRMGLQPTTDLARPGAVVAGPFHPAFRQLVEADLCFDLLNRLIPYHNPGDPPVMVACAPSRVADVVGQRRSNIKRMLNERGVRIAAVQERPTLSTLEIAVLRHDGVRTGNFLNDLKYDAEEILNV